MARSGLIYLKRDSLEFHPAGEEPKVLSFSSKATDNLELKSEETIKKEITKFLVAEDLKPHKVDLFLSKDIIFTKSSVVKDERKKEKIIKDFLEEIPIENTKIAHIILPTNKGFTVVVSNKELFTAVKEGFEENKWKIGKVVPEIGKIQDLSQDKQAKKLMNMLEKKKSDNKVVIWIVGGITILGILGYFGLMLLKNKTAPVASVEAPQEQIEIQSEEEVAEPELETVMISKEDITITVLNGSGVSGQAGTTKDLLETFEYVDIEVGNASSQDFEETIISYKETVPEEYLDEITNALQEIYESIDEQIQTENDASDIVITTGVLLTDSEE